MFCGRVLVFLARSLPLTEKSGLNMNSQFNTDNVTKIDEQDQTAFQQQNNDKAAAAKSSSTAEPMEEGETTEDAPGSSAYPVDYQLYRRFWQLQQFFANPLRCYDRKNWLLFKAVNNRIFYFI